MRDSVHTSTDYWLKETDSDGGPRGLHLMSHSALEQLLGSLGIAGDTPLVAYDDLGGRGAARFWWALRYLGHARVMIMNGGWQAWMDAGLPTTYAVPAFPRAAYRSRPDRTRLATVDDVMAAIGDDRLQLIDARSDEEWSGADRHGNRRGGHVPGARHLEWTRLTHGDSGRLLPPADLAAVLESAGTERKPTITYCQGGVRASLVAFVLELMGFDEVRVYDGSMREWGNRDDTPLDASG